MSEVYTVMYEVSDGILAECDDMASPDFIGSQSAHIAKQTWLSK